MYILIGKERDELCTEYKISVYFRDARMMNVRIPASKKYKLTKEKALGSLPYNPNEEELGSLRQLY